MVFFRSSNGKHYGKPCLAKQLQPVVELSTSTCASYGHLAPPLVPLRKWMQNRERHGDGTDADSIDRSRNSFADGDLNDTS